MVPYLLIFIELNDAGVVFMVSKKVYSVCEKQEIFSQEKAKLKKITYK